MQQDEAVGAARDTGLRSVLAALDVLDLFAHEPELGITDIARRVGVAKSTAHRLVSTLCCRGLLEQVPDSRRYRLGLHLYELGQISQDRLQLRKAALPVLKRLQVATGQTVHLSVPDGADVIFIERLQGLEMIPLIGDRLRRQPLHTTSAGKAIAAFNPEAARARELAGLPARTDATITTLEEWHRELAEVRRCGYAVCNGDNYAGVASIAVPIRDGSGTAIAAISLVGAANRLIVREDHHRRLLQGVAARLIWRVPAHPSPGLASGAPVAVTY